MVAQVPPRQQSVLSNDIAGPVSEDMDSHMLAQRTINDHSSLSEIQVNFETERQMSPADRLRSRNAVQSMMISNMDDRHLQPATTIHSVNHNSALVEPYLSNAHSPSRPKR